MKSITLSIAILLLVSLCKASDDDKPFQSSNTMWSKQITRALDLREKQNQPLFSTNQQITKILIDGVKSGQLTAYASDSLINSLSVTEFLTKIEIPREPDQDTSYMTEWEKEEYMASLASNTDAEYFFPQDFYQKELKETLLFDKERSQMKYDIQSLTFFFPADHVDNERGIQMHIGSFDYKQVEQYFIDNANTIWYNPNNDREHRSLADAFKLRLFSSYIIKVSNPNNEF